MMGIYYTDNTLIKDCSNYSIELALITAIRTSSHRKANIDLKLNGNILYSIWDSKGLLLVTRYGDTPLTRTAKQTLNICNINRKRNIERYKAYNY